MVSRRVARLSQAVREVVSTSILFQLRDPRIKNVTVLRVEVAADVRTAKVYVSVMGTEKERALCLHGLNASRGFLQSKIADRIETRYTPVLKFILDDAISSSADEAVRILQELEIERRELEAKSGVAEEKTDDVVHEADEGNSRDDDSMQGIDVQEE
ncbi:MAG: 30S ribosome-binding factor RbfA [Rhodopirellula sp.]|nr:30S ribosome-binding factor RbfA [Rhodopirellula sp.]